MTLAAVVLSAAGYAQTIPTPCDRACMTGLADQYLAAM
jgi:hypothetical protein